MSSCDALGTKKPPPVAITKLFLLDSSSHNSNSALRKAHSPSFWKMLAIVLPKRFSISASVSTSVLPSFCATTLATLVLPVPIMPVMTRLRPRSLILELPRRVEHWRVSQSASTQFRERLFHIAKVVAAQLFNQRLA